MNDNYLRLEKAFKELFDLIRDKLIDNLNVLIYGKEEKEYVHNYNWYAPKNILKDHQVFNRKPIFIRARNSL